MCGIAGMWNSSGTGISPERLRAAMNALGHRGPDDAGYLGWKPGGAAVAARAPSVAEGCTLVLGHRRLSILDLSTCGWQPMMSADGRFALVFNGELYNYVELREELARRGRNVRSTGDTEVMLAALAEWGPQAVTRFVGMFAFALLDTLEQRLLLARDPFGIKPLYYRAAAGQMAFASEIKGLLTLPEVRREVNPSLLYDYLHFGQADGGSATMFADVRQLPAGHLLDVCLSPGATPAETRAYWSPDLARRSTLSFSQASEELRERFLDNVRLHLRSDVPVGAALSGGIDSSAIVCAVRHLDPHADMHTFSYVAQAPATNEERWATIVSNHAGTTRHLVHPVAEQLLRDLDALILAQDEPFGSTSLYAQYRVFQCAREAGIKVMLDGQGADELLAGYTFFLGGRLASLIRRGRVGDALALANAARQRPDLHLSSVLVEAAARALPPAARDAARRFTGAGRSPAWMVGSWFMDRGVQPRHRRAYAGAGVLREQISESLATGLPSLLRYEDRNSMAHSIESRVPFLTPDFADFALSLPEEFLLDRNGVGKHVFRAAMRGIVPDQVLDRREKVAFQTPERAWLNTLAPRVEQIITGDTARRIPALSTNAVLREWQDFRRSARAYDWRAWRWINLIRWAELYAVTFE